MAIINPAQQVWRAKTFDGLNAAYPDPCPHPPTLANIAENRWPRGPCHPLSEPEEDTEFLVKSRISQTATPVELFIAWLSNLVARES